MFNQDPLQSLEKAKKYTQGKGIMGWLTKLFIGKSNLAQMDASITMAEQQLKNIQHQQQIRLTGTQAKATVLKIVDTGSFINHNPLVNLTVKVKPTSGREFEKTFQTVVSLVAIPRINDEISIKYNPNNTDEIALD
ncbi:MAG: hypothetical protein NW226_15645 [Microscillaceae bacterium]|nr:hypothetical protein [Microscillaceae bacterium]